MGDTAGGRFERHGEAERATQTQTLKGVTSGKDSSSSRISLQEGKSTDDKGSGRGIWSFAGRF
jgi:hypothetical protein